MRCWGHQAVNGLPGKKAHEPPRNVRDDSCLFISLDSANDSFRQDVPAEPCVNRYYAEDLSAAKDGTQHTAEQIAAHRSLGRLLGLATAEYATEYAAQQIAEAAAALRLLC